MSIVLVLILLLGLSYAWFTLTLNGTKQNVVKVGKLSLALTEGEAITIDNMIPTYTNVALDGKPYTFTVTNDGTVDAVYQIYLDNTGTLTDLSYFNYAIKKDGKILSMNSLDKLTESKLFSGTIQPGKSSSYELYIWLDANITTEDLSALTGTYESTIRIESTQQKERKLARYIAEYDCNGKADCTGTVDDVTYFENIYYWPNNMQYIWYSGKMWVVTSYDKEGNMKAVTAQTQTYIPWGTNLDYQGSYVESWLNEKFLPSLNNPEKFLVTDYAWNYSDEIRGEVNDEYTWVIGNDKIVRSPIGILNKMDYVNGSITNPVFNSSNRIFVSFGNHNYMGTQRSSGGLWTTGMGFLANRGYGMSGVLPAIVFNKDVIVVSGSGTLNDPYRLKGDTFGKVGDFLNTRYAGEYVAFGEGINSSYRISEVENGKVKLISTNSLRSIEIEDDGWEIWNFLNPEIRNNPYPYKAGSGDYLHYLPEDQTNYPMAYFLNHEFLTPANGYLSSSDKNMIVTNQTFYTGTVTENSSYTDAKDPSKAVTATVGLPILGETFNFPQSEEMVSVKDLSYSYDRTLFMTNNGSNVYELFPSSNLKAAGNRYSFRPSLYLKNTVKIKGGSGTKGDPYILTME